jgi:chitodextrinase
MLIIFSNCSKKTVAATVDQSKLDTEVPSVPTNLAGVAVSPSQINLSWTASTDNVAVKGYKIFQNGVDFAQVENGITTLNDGTLMPSTTYNYTVLAYDAAWNYSAKSAVISVTTMPTPVYLPTVYTELPIVNSNASITFSGTVGSNGGGALTAYVFIITWTHEVNGFGIDSISIPANGSFSYTKVNCTPGLIYSCKVGAVNSAGIGFGTEMGNKTTGYHIGQQIDGIGQGPSNSNIAVTFWVDAVGDKALYALKQDINPGTGAKWWPQGAPYTTLGANGNFLGGGDMNTLIITTAPYCGHNAAAKLCKEFVIGLSANWILPNKAEMEALWAQRNLPGLSGTFNSNRYWTSTEGTQPSDAYFVSWSNGVSSLDLKNGDGGVRPIKKAGNW